MFLTLSLCARRGMGKTQSSGKIVTKWILEKSSSESSERENFSTAARLLVIAVRITDDGKPRTRTKTMSRTMKTGREETQQHVQEETSGQNSKSKKPLTRRLFLRGEKTNSNERETRKRRGRFLRAVQIGIGADNGDDEEEEEDVKFCLQNLLWTVPSLNIRTPAL